MYCKGLRDIIGTEIQLDATVLCTHNNRIVLGRISKANPETKKVTVLPLQTTTGGRRPPPPPRPLVREEYNVFVVNDAEVLMGTIKGYGHNTGEWDDEDEDI